MSRDALTTKDKEALAKKEKAMKKAERAEMLRKKKEEAWARENAWDVGAPRLYQEPSKGIKW